MWSLSTYLFALQMIHVAFDSVLMWLFSPLDVNNLLEFRDTHALCVRAQSRSAEPTRRRRKLMAVPAGAGADVYITLGETPYLLVDRELKNVRLRPGVMVGPAG